MRRLNEIIIHTTATTKNWMAGTSVDAKIAEITRWHVEDRGWKDIGYHFVIDRNGAVGKGRPITEIGAHVSGHNLTSIGIALVGGYGGEPNDKFSIHYTFQQQNALIKLINELQMKYGSMSISGHNEYANKACPCFNVKAWLAQPEVASRLGTISPPEETTTPVTPTEGKNTDWYRWRLAEIRDMAQKALEDGNKP